jgi:hypothetical protein
MPAPQPYSTTCHAEEGKTGQKLMTIPPPATADSLVFPAAGIRPSSTISARTCNREAQ